MEQKNSKKGLLIGIGVTLGVLCIVAIAVVAGFVFLKEDPTAKLVKSAVALNDEITSVSQTGVSNEDLKNLLSIYESGNYQADYNISMKSEAFGDDMNMDGTCIHDQENKVMHMSCNISMAGTSFTGTDIYADEEKMYIFMPDMLDGTMVLPTKDYGKIYNESYMAKLQGNTVDEDYSMDLFEEMPKMDVPSGDYMSVLNAAKVTEVSEGKEDASGQKVYYVTLPKDSVDQMLAESGSDLNLSEDVKAAITVNVTEKITSINNTENPATLSDGTAFTFSLDFRREQDQLNKYELSMELGEDTQMKVGYTFADSYYEIQCSYPYDEQIQEISFAGKITPTEDGLSLDVSDFNVGNESEQRMEIDGNILLNPLTETVRIPDTQPEYELLKMDEAGFMDMVTQMGNKMMENAGW